MSLAKIILLILFTIMKIKIKINIISIYTVAVKLQCPLMLEHVYVL